ncbi:MAG: acyltransferase [Chloroflexi bacterium]|nr:acyltransferase [Chloroflexota bacterium]
MNTKPNRNPLQKVWSQAAALAERTPETRNRYVDFLRAVSIMMVIAGHWLVVAPYVEGGELVSADILSRMPWTQYLSWVFQVMPVFFIVGGFSNGISWKSAQRRQQEYGVWLSARLHRLVRPLLPLIVLWTVVAAVAHILGVDPDLIQAASQFALLPTWFLVVYTVVVILAPATHAMWERWRIGSFWMFAICAILVDIVVFATGYQAVGWINYFFIWLAVHQLGYAWQDGQLAGPRNSLPWAIGGLLVLIGLVKFGPYPLSMVTVPGEEISNTLPPNLTMLALGVFQGGVLLSLETPLRRWLENKRLWTAIVLVNGMIMTIFLWHITAMTFVSGLALALGGVGLTMLPGSTVWWVTRPVWLTILIGALMIFVFTFARFERPSKRSAKTTTALVQLIIGAVLICTGLAFLSLDGVSGDGWLGLRVGVLLTTFVGFSVLEFSSSDNLFRSR